MRSNPAARPRASPGVGWMTISDISLTIARRQARYAGDLRSIGMLGRTDRSQTTWNSIR
jgi:hypothetical protein